MGHCFFFFFSSRRRHTRLQGDWSSDVCSSDLPAQIQARDGPRRREEALDATQGRFDSAELAGVIEHYGVTDVLVDMDRTDSAAWAQLASAEILTPIASGDRWRLYSYDSSR